MKIKRIIILNIAFVSLWAGVAFADDISAADCVITTSMGQIYIDLFESEAPHTVENFISLAEGTHPSIKGAGGKPSPFYDGLVFHRVIDNFMIQGGCPEGDGTGGPGFTFDDEMDAEALGLDKIKVISFSGRPNDMLAVNSQQDYQMKIVGPLVRHLGITSQEEFNIRQGEIQMRIENMTVKECYELQGYKYTSGLNSKKPVRGVIAMANSGPDTNGSQFFINLADTPWLTGKHTVFGQVVKGMDVVDRIGSVPVDRSSRPVEDVKIISIRSCKKNLSGKQSDKESGKESDK